MGSIIIIDPNSEVRTLVADILARAGHSVKEAADVPQGVAQLRAERADLVVTDLVRRTGTPALAALQREFPEIEVITLSDAPHSTGYLRLAATLGGRRTRTNPFMNRKVMDVLHEMLAGVAAYGAHVLYQSSRQSMAGQN